MSFTALSLNWQMTALFLLAVLPVCFVMKLVAFWGTPESKDLAVILSPFPSPASVKQALPLSAGPRLIRRFLLALAVCVCGYWLCGQLWREVRLPAVLLRFIGGVMVGVGFTCSLTVLLRRGQKVSRTSGAVVGTCG